MLALAKVWTEQTLSALYNEFWGEDIDHPILRRILAYVLDYLVFVVPIGLLVFALTPAEYYFPGSLFPLAITFSSVWLYFSFCASSYFKGQTLGKRVFRIKVVNENATFIGIGAALLRSLPIAFLTESLSILIAV